MMQFKYRASYHSKLWGNRPMTLGRLLREAPLTEEELAEKEKKRRIMIARMMRAREAEWNRIKEEL